jgi:hypothetical protein
MILAYHSCAYIQRNASQHALEILVYCGTIYSSQAIGLAWVPTILVNGFYEKVYITE